MAMADQNLLSRSEARASDLKRYYTGKSCKHGHRAERFVSTGACCSCNHGGKPPDPPEVRHSAPRESPKRQPHNDLQWTDDIRARLIDEYINTGDIVAAREALQCSASDYHRELDANEAFRNAITRAEKLAIQTLEDRAIHMAGKGNDKLIIAILKAKLGDQYADRVKVDTTHTIKMSDAELDARIRKLGGGHILDGVAPTSRGLLTNRNGQRLC